MSTQIIIGVQKHCLTITYPPNINIWLELHYFFTTTDRVLGYPIQEKGTFHLCTGWTLLKALNGRTRLMKDASYPLQSSMTWQPYKWRSHSLAFSSLGGPQFGEPPQFKQHEWSSEKHCKVYEAASFPLSTYIEATTTIAWNLIFRTTEHGR